MNKMGRTRLAIVLALLSWVCSVSLTLWAAQDEADGQQIELIVGLLQDTDREMRAVGLQYIRDGVPGEAATRKFAELLPGLTPESQADLLQALGDRGDKSARAAVLQMVPSQQPAVRAAAIEALGSLGTVADVPLLAEKAAAGADRAATAARRSLVRLPGDDVTDAIVSQMAEADPAVRVELLRALAARNAKQALATVLTSTADEELSVRLAALDALRFLAGENDTAVVVQLVQRASGAAERRKAELALLAVCSRGRQATVGAIVAGLADAESSSRITMLRALGRAGGADALQVIVDHLKHKENAVRDEAVRLLSRWPDVAAVDHLLPLAQTGESLRHKVLAIRGLVRLASPHEDQPANLDLLAKTLNATSRPEEKRLVLGVLGSVPTPESLALVTTMLDDSSLAEEAGLAAVMIAEKMQVPNTDQVRAAMNEVLNRAQRKEVRERAKKVRDRL